MLSNLFYQLWEGGHFYRAIWETIYMTLLSSFFSHVIGLPLGILLSVTGEDGVRPLLWLNRSLGFVVNIFRSIPFVILMVAMLPVAKLIVGTSLGNRAMVVTLVIAATPYVARMVESSIKEVDAGVIEAARAMGSSPFQLIYKVLVPEAKPALITGSIISTITVLGYSAMAGTIGGGGLGTVAITYGYQRSNSDIIWICVAATIIIVQVIQEIGMRISLKSDKRL